MPGTEPELLRSGETTPIMLSVECNAVHATQGAEGLINGQHRWGCDSAVRFGFVTQSQVVQFS